MNPSLAVNDRQLASAIRLLELEQRELLPSQMELKIYNWFNVDTAVVAGLFAWSLFPGGFPEVVFWTLALAIVIYVVLFVMSLRLIRKFWRLARLRRRLGLVRKLAPYFERRRSRTAQALTLILSGASVVAGLLALGFVVFVAWQPDVAPVEDLAFAVSALFAAIGMLSWPLMQRAKRRLQIVTNLQRSLSRGESGASDDGFGRAARQILGQMEQFQISEERRQSVRAAPAANATGYAVQLSVEARQARARLDPELARAVEDCVLALADDPFQVDAIEEAKAGIATLKVPGTPLEIGYSVDRQAQIVRILHMHPNATSGAGAR